MAEERPNMFLRAMDAVQSIIRPDYTRNREVQCAATLAEATARRETIDAARAEAMDSLCRLGDLPLAEREQEMRLEGVAPTMTSDWSSTDWTDRAKLEAKVEADVLAWAEGNKLDLNVHQDRLAAYEGVATAYAEAHLAVNFADWEEEYWKTHPRMTAVGAWKTDEPNREYRTSVAEIDGGFHPAYETSHMGGDGPYHHSDIAFPTVKAAEAVAESFYRHAEYGDGEAGFRRELADLGQLPEGYGIDIDASAPLTPIALSEHPIFGDLDEAGPERDPEMDLLRRQQEAVAAGREAEARGEPVIHIHGRPYVDPGNDTEPSQGEDREATSADARASRITTAFADMADAVSAGERPEFRTDEQAAAFRQDLEARYGEGVMQRLRAGDSSDLAQDVTDRNRLQLVGAAVRMVADSHAVLRDQVQEPITARTNAIDRDSGPDLDL
ncbi:hypothetical protein [uncultured Paracoccus sp.]|uniref:hypothetical protein n=1 Tax=uncultured Paracoccus sp. TaxID=189685 RepID=UPI0026313929|nr:hypothetical protein [uncultured Paracoccus sp.]